MLRKLLMVLLIVALMISGYPASAEKSPYEGVTVTILERDTAVLPFDENSAAYQAIQEATGISIEFMLVSDTDWTTKTNTLLASNNMPDIMRVQFSQVNQYANDGMFVNLTEQIEQGKLPNYASVLDKVGDVMNYYKVNGDLYSYQMIWEIGLPNGAVPYIRGDVLDELGLEVPASFDELHTTLKAIKDYDPVNYPWVTRWQSLQIDYAYGVGGLAYYDFDKKQYVSGYTSDRYMDYLAYCNTLYSEGLVDPDFITASVADWQEAMKNGSAYFTFNNCVFVNQFNTALRTEEPDAFWEPMYTLENPWGEKRGLWSAGVGDWQPTQFSWVVSADSENIEAALYLLDYMYSAEGIEVTNWGTEGKTFGFDENGEYYMLPEFVNQVANSEITMQSQLSGADLGFCCVINDWANRACTLTDEGVALYEFWLSDKDMDVQVPAPVFTVDETERLAELRSKFDIITADLNAFHYRYAPNRRMGRCDQ